jgi:hypothetical protein
MNTNQPRAEQAHTPTPWKRTEDNRIVHVSGNYPGAKEGFNVHSIASCGDDMRGDINAAFIVTACNSHAQLTADVKRLREALTGAEKALAKALPFCPPDKEAHFIGEWLGEVRSALAETTPTE